MANNHEITSFTVQLDNEADNEEVVINTFEDDPMEWCISFHTKNWTNIVALRNAEKQITKAINAMGSSIYHVNNSEKSK
tara:strand:+ start:286 stop:522 length:237 start_codon:yes stop_codon:yes gene_type:complete